MTIVPLIGQDTIEFDRRVENEIERIHSRIITEKYGEVYLQSGSKCTATMDSALSELHRFLDGKYPWLGKKARTNINYAFIMAWK
jgi:hypothetical protein